MRARRIYLYSYIGNIIHILYTYVHVYMDGRMGGWEDGRMDGWMGGCMDGWEDGRMDGWMDGWMGGWMDGWEDASMDPVKKVRKNTEN